MNAWNDWIKQEDKTKRKLIVQTINALRLSYQWDSLAVSLKNLEIAQLTPTESPEAIQQATKICQWFKWSAKAIRADFR